jgi:hypothetical protein
VQNAAIELLGDSVKPQATMALIGLLSFDSYRARAVSALSRHTMARTTQVSAALEQASAEVAEALVSVIASLPSSSGEPMLLTALGLSNEHARRAAARALRFAFDSESTTRALARAASQDADPEVRRVAAARLS